jgi:hypothetical protein
MLLDLQHTLLLLLLLPHLKLSRTSLWLATCWLAVSTSASMDARS